MWHSYYSAHNIRNLSRDTQTFTKKTLYTRIRKRLPLYKPLNILGYDT